jgi:parallel beta-helix repeat protein
VCSAEIPWWFAALLSRAYSLKSGDLCAKKTMEAGPRVIVRAMRVAFVSSRLIRNERLGPRIACAVCLAAGASTAAVLPAGPATAAVFPAAQAAVKAAHVSTAARAYSQTFVVTNLRNAGPGSLRAAINAANASWRGKSTLIRFSVHGTIILARPLPAMARKVTIDGTSAPTHVSGGPPVVEVECFGHPGLRFAAGSDGSQLLGLAVDHASGNGVTLDASSVTLNDNYIGLDLAGAADGNHGHGVYVSPASSRNFIGLNGSGASGAVANVISGNWGSGIVLDGSSGNTVVANRIGTNAAGTSAIANRGEGIWITGRSWGNEIGGTAFVDSATGKANNPTGSKGTVTPVFVVPPLGNLVSGNGRNGVLIDAGSRGNALNGNFIGTTANGDGALGNAGDGVWVDQAPDNSLVGCKFVNNPFVYYNVISGNGRNGLRITSSDRVTVQGNFFGVGANNTAIVKNRLDGILIDGSSANTQVGGVIPLGNVSAGNGWNGIEVTGQVHGFVTFNTFGGLLAFKGAAPNGNDGLLITSAGGNNLARTNVFSGNTRNGIELAGNASGVTVDPDIAGLNTKGDGVLPNGGDGLLIDGNAHGNIIGGTLRSVIPQNTFSGNAGYGVAITGRAHGNRVFSSFIGTQILGVKALGNHKGGVLIAGGAYGNVIGQIIGRPANLISGNTGIGVTLLSGTWGNFVLNNYIGLDRFGRFLPNSGRPIVNAGHGNIILGNQTRPIRH